MSPASHTGAGAQTRDGTQGRRNRRRTRWALGRNWKWTRTPSCPFPMGPARWKTKGPTGGLGDIHKENVVCAEVERGWTCLPRAEVME